MVSQPPDSGPLDRYKNYVYRSDGWQRQIFVYHAELGINWQHMDFHDRKIEWLYTQRAHYTRQAVKSESTLTEPEYRGHSTCTASKATGRLYGTAKRATLVVVKMPDYKLASVFEIFTTIADHIRDHGRQYWSIVSVSWGTKQGLSSMDQPFVEYLVDTLNELVYDLHAMVVFAAGNEAENLDSIGRPRRKIDTFPAKYAIDESRHSRTLAASNCDLYGHRWPSSQQASDEIHQLFAPGVDVQCASSGSVSRTNKMTGTSFCEKSSIVDMSESMLTAVLSRSSYSRRHCEHDGYRRDTTHPP